MRVYQALINNERPVLKGHVTYVENVSSSTSYKNNTYASQDYNNSHGPEYNDHDHYAGSGFYYT